MTVLRCLPVPVSAPPYDDERGDPPPVQGALALDFRLPNGLPAVPSPQLALVDPLPRSRARRPSDVTATAATAPGALTAPGAPAAPAVPDDRGDVERWSSRQPTSAQHLPDPRTWTARLVQGIVEALSGERPVQQLARWTDERLYADLAARARHAARRRDARAADAARRARGGAGGRAAAAAEPVVRANVRSVHACAPADGVVEATALVQVGRRCRAVAVRLESLDGRWRATVATFV